jgi:hypothetical protein
MTEETTVHCILNVNMHQGRIFYVFHNVTEFNTNCKTVVTI